MTPHDAARMASERLHHLSMAYIGSLMELVSGTPIAFCPSDHPGLKQCRDFLDLILLTRAEINGLTNLLVKAKLVTVEQVAAEFAEQYEWLAQQKQLQFGCEVFDGGLKYSAKPQP